MKRKVGATKSPRCAWEVYSTAVVDRVIMVRDKISGATGYIEKYTSKEWAAAFYAPSKPYPWKDAARVIRSK